MKKPKVNPKSIEAGTKNLIPLSKRSPEEKAAIIEKSHASRRANTEKRKNAELIARELLKLQGQDLTSCIDNTALKEKAAALDLSIYDVLTLKMIDQGLKGSVKAYETIRDSAGDKPVNKSEQNINVINESDSVLLKRIAGRLGLSTDEIIDADFTDL